MENALDIILGSDRQAFLYLIQGYGDGAELHQLDPDALRNALGRRSVREMLKREGRMWSYRTDTASAIDATLRSLGYVAKWGELTHYPHVGTTGFYWVRLKWLRKAKEAKPCAV